MAGYLCKSLRIWFGNVPYLASTGFEADIPQTFCLAARTRYIENHRNTCILYIYMYIYIYMNSGPVPSRRKQKNTHLQTRVTDFLVYLWKEALLMTYSHQSNPGRIHSSTIVTHGDIDLFRLRFICWWTSTCNLGLYNTKIGVLMHFGHGRFQIFQLWSKQIVTKWPPR